MRLNEDPPEEIGTPEAGWDGKARRTQRPQGERAERFELPEPVPGTFSAAAGDREDMPEGQRDGHAGKSRAAGRGKKGCCCLPGGLYRRPKAGSA